MRAVALDTVPATPAVTEIDVPRPAVGEVLVEVAAASVNAFDVAVAAGELRDLMEHRFPLVLGKDFAGTVVEVGEGVDGVAAGDRVFGVLMAPFLQAWHRRARACAGSGTCPRGRSTTACSGKARRSASPPVRRSRTAPTPSAG